MSSYGRGSSVEKNVTSNSKKGGTKPAEDRSEEKFTSKGEYDVSASPFV